ncbi:MAG TPA: LuxR C-terminal-related transcriptional regulator [Streptosporangiaceae bacterium]|nr:LuxR C-terminal-related transcriptional regulator [Streptosporangiaceae bacterium]
MALGVIGISPEAELVYDVLLSGRPATRDELVSATRMTPDQVREALGELTQSRLAERLPGSPPSFLALDPAIALDILLLVREREVKNARLLAQDLGERYRLAAGKRDPAELVEIVSGTQASLRRIEQAERSARHLLRGFDKPPYAADTIAPNQIEADLLLRGGSARMIYERAAVDLPGRLAEIVDGCGIGERARVLPHLPTKLLLVDDTLAILPLQAAPEAIESIVVVHKSALLEAITALFESLWLIASPVHYPAANGTPGDQPSPEERGILALLTAGIPDEVIARELGLSERTYQRRVRSMMERLRVQTRFQLARQATRRGWLDDEPDQPG